MEYVKITLEHYKRLQVCESAIEKRKRVSLENRKVYLLEDDELEGEIANMTDSLEEAVERIDESRIPVLEKEVSDLKEKLKTLKAQSEGYKTRFYESEKRKGDVEKRIVRIPKWVKYLYGIK